MKAFSLNLSKDYQRPIIELYGISTLIDTGAMIPTFSFPVPILEKAFEAKLILDKAQIGGFGGVCHGKVYSLHNFKIGSLTYDTFEVFVPNESVSKHPFLLPASVFYGTDYEIDTINNKFTVRIPKEASYNRDFYIKDLNGKLYAQIDDVLLQDDILPKNDIDNYTQLDYFIQNGKQNGPEID